MNDEKTAARNPDYKAAVQDIIDKAPFITETGIQLEKVEPGECETSLVTLPMHLQQDNCIHAGVVATLADHTAGCAATSLVEQDQYVLTAEFKINFLRPTQAGRLACRAKVIGPGRRLIVAESEVRTSGSDEPDLLAKALVTLAVLDKSKTAMMPDSCAKKKP